MKNVVWRPRSCWRMPVQPGQVSATALARMACQWCVFFVCVLCSSHYCSTFLLSYFSSMFTVSMFTVGMYTVGCGIVCVKRGSPPHSSTVVRTCVHFLVSYFSIDCWMCFWHMFIDLATVWDPFSINFPSLWHHFFEHCFHISFVSI